MDKFKKDLVSLLPDLKRFAFYLSRNNDLAADLLQDTCLRAYEKQHLYVESQDCELKSWLFRIMRNLWIDQLRKNLKNSTSDVDVESLEVPEKQSSEQTIELRSMMRKVEIELNDLSPQDQAIIKNIIILGNSYAQTSELMSLPMGTVMNRLYRARQSLKENLGITNGSVMMLIPLCVPSQWFGTNDADKWSAILQDVNYSSNPPQKEFQDRDIIKILNNIDESKVKKQSNTEFKSNFTNIYIAALLSTDNSVLTDELKNHQKSVDQDRKNVDQDGETTKVDNVLLREEQKFDKTNKSTMLSNLIDDENSSDLLLINNDIYHSHTKHFNGKYFDANDKKAPSLEENEHSVTQNSQNIFSSNYNLADAIEVLGTNSADQILGSYSNDIIYGQAGNDIIWGNDGNDIIKGGDGMDILLGGYGNDIIYGGKGSDIVIGNEGENILYGDDGDDLIIFSGSGSNIVNGGTGSDTFLFELISSGTMNTIKGFELQNPNNNQEGDIIDITNLFENNDVISDFFNQPTYEQEQHYDVIEARIFDTLFKIDCIDDNTLIEVKDPYADGPNIEIWLENFNFRNHFGSEHEFLRELIDNNQILI